MECVYNIEGECQIASRLAKQSVMITRGACEHCIKQDEPRSENCVTATLACNSWRRNIGKYRQLAEQYSDLIRNDATRQIGRPGDKLINILVFLGITYIEGCGCEEHAKQMNEWGSEICRQRINEIIDWMEEAAIERGWKWIFSREAAKLLILLACNLADGKSWSNAKDYLQIISISR